MSVELCHQEHKDFISIWFTDSPEVFVVFISERVVNDSYNLIDSLVVFLLWINFEKDEYDPC